MQKDDDFLKSPVEAPVHRKVLTRGQKHFPQNAGRHLTNCARKYDDIISKNSGDIGKTMLIEMEIDTGNHPPIASKPYTLSLKHYNWVQKEIETLERVGIIERSISPWASTRSDSSKEKRTRRTVRLLRVNTHTTTYT